MRLDSKPNVRCKSYSRIIVLLVFLMVLTFAPDLAALGSKCQNRNTKLTRRKSQCEPRRKTAACSQSELPEVNR